MASLIYDGPAGAHKGAAAKLNDADPRSGSRGMSETPVSTANSHKQKAHRPNEELSCHQTSQQIRR